MAREIPLMVSTGYPSPVANDLARISADSIAARERAEAARDAAQALVVNQDARLAAIEPNVRPTHRQFGYGDNLALTPADDWQTIIEVYDGNGVITLADGDYVATRRLKPRGKPFLRGVTLGGATINANWEFLQGTGARLWEINLVPQDEADLDRERALLESEPELVPGKMDQTKLPFAK